VHREEAEEGLRRSGLVGIHGQHVVGVLVAPQPVDGTARFFLGGADDRDDQGGEECHVEEETRVVVEEGSLLDKRGFFLHREREREKKHLEVERDEEGGEEDAVGELGGEGGEEAI